jgi:hypothetical protein
MIAPGGARAAVNRVVARAKEKLASARLNAPSRPFTVAAAVIALVACTRPQILHVVVDLPWPQTIGDGLVRFVLLLLFVLALTLSAAVGVVLVIAPQQVKAEEPEHPSWHARLGRRTGEALARRWRALDAVADSYNRLETIAGKAHTGGLGRRRAVGALFIAVAGVLLFLPLLIGNVGATTTLAVNALPATAVVASGLWFLTATRGGSSPLRRTLGRYSAMLTLGVIFGELIWHLPHLTKGDLSWRLYSIWGLPFLMWIIVATGRVLDRLTRPWRLAALVALIVLPQCDAGFLIRTGAMSGENEQQQMRAADQAEWFDRFERRIAGGSAGDPVVFVAASGGGSRAAMFTALVLEHLSHTNFQGTAAAAGERSIADNIALISAVSGGSLASAYYLAGQGLPPEARSRPIPLQYMKKEIAGSMKQLAARYQQQAGASTGDALESAHLVERRVRSFRAIAAELSANAEDPSSAPWLFHSVFVDEMATDFMAPLLRGVFTPFVERGQSVSNFWSRQFGWEGIRQRDCWGAAGSPSNPWLCSSAQARPRPLVFFNATEVATGRRVVIDFPPLPPGFLGPDMSASSDLGGPYNIALADAVRLSANFPWGFEIGLFRRLLSPPATIVKTTESERPIVKLTDGGVIDNTGIDVLAAWLDRIEALSRPGTVGPLADRALRIRSDLLRRGVMLVEVDSGARPASSQLLGTLFPAFSDPLDALSFAGYGSSVTMKAGQISRMRETMLRLASQEIDDPAARALDRTALFRHVPFVCNSADGVMTAWALGPEDKAKIFTLFLGDAKAKDEVLGGSQDAQRQIASAEKDVETARAVGPIATKFAAKMAEEIRRTEEERQQEESDAARSERPLNAEEPPSAAQSPPVPLGARPPPAIAAAAKKPAAAPVGASPRPVPPAPKTEWVYLGQYDRSAKRWITKYFDVPNGTAPEQLTGAKLKALGRVRVRSAMPDPDAEFGQVRAVLRRGDAVAVIAEPLAWESTGFIWARVEGRRAGSSGTVNGAAD